LIVPPFPAASRPSKMSTTLRPLCFTQYWSFTSSTCKRLSSFSYALLFIGSRFSTTAAASARFFSRSRCFSRFLSLFV
jgi:hypothetical protein